MAALFLSALPLYAQVYTLPSGDKFLDEGDRLYIWKEFELPNGEMFWAWQIYWIPDANPVKEYARQQAFQSGVQFWILDAVINCESEWRHEGIYGDKGKAYGIMQFHRGTFDYFKKEAERPELDYYDWQDQILLGVWALANDKGGHWTCWRKLALR